ncbi:MAG: NADH-quinone oxidoreductase subunit NuoF [Chloroflexi bacterium]|nr:NADH-quinone oxidoreductase subunit NuoF [Chloroflexota bacterium]
MAHILLRDLDIPDIWQFDTYVANGGYEGLKQAIGNHTPAEVIQIVLDANLRGRGGAGFPTGRKWSFIPQNEAVKYVVVNADESEPGTFKDRQLLEKNPHQVIEGAMIAAYAIQATAVYIYCRGEFWDLAHALEERIEEARQANLVGENVLGSGWNCPMFVHLGAGAYICGEESALLNSLQGLLGQPRVRPPFPAQKGGGLYYEPTVVNNVETLANVPWILVNGADAFKQIGTSESPGPKIFCMSGHIARPGNYELPLGITFRELIFEHAGGIPNGKQLKGILPSGASGPVLRATDEVLDSPLTYESVAKLGSTLGSASFILMDEDTDMVWAAAKMAHFFKHESCGKCTPCREGTYWLERIYERMMRGEGTEHDLHLLNSVPRQMVGVVLCALGDFAANPVLSTLKNFPDEYERYIRQRPVREQTADTLQDYARKEAGEHPAAVGEGGL